MQRGPFTLDCTRKRTQRREEEEEEDIEKKKMVEEENLREGSLSDGNTSKDRIILMQMDVLRFHYHQQRENRDIGKNVSVARRDILAL